MSRFLCAILLFSFMMLEFDPAASAATTTWSTATSNTANDLNGAVYGNGRWMIAGSGDVLTSTDGTTWSPVSVGGSTIWNHAAYSNNLWILVGTAGQIYTSSDAVTWTSRTSGIAYDFWAIAPNGSGTTVAVSGGGYIATSFNGTAWTSQSVSAQSFYGVAYGGGQWVAVGNMGVVYSSADGIAWTQRSSSVSETLEGVTYGNGLYVAVGDNGTVITSTDGITWTSRPHGTASYFDAAYYAGKFYMCGTGGAILSSLDAMTWTAETSPVSTDLMRMAAGPDKLVAVGVGGTIVTGVLSSNADLNGLTISSGTLSPAFNASTDSYTASVPYTTASMNVTPMLADADASLTVNNASAPSGVPVSVPLSVGANTITVRVTAPNATTHKTYTITVTRAAPSTNNNLSNLTISSGTITPGFDAGTTAYSANVASNVGSINVTATVADPTATLKIKGSAATSGSAIAVPLAAGPNTIQVDVTAEDGNVKTYTLTIRKPSNNADLGSLTSSTGMFLQAFSPGATSYTLSVPYGTAEADLTPVLADSKSTLIVDGSPATSGSPVPLSWMANTAKTVTMIVTAEDGITTKTYDVTIRSAPAFTWAPANTGQTIRLGASLAPLETQAAAGETVTYSLTGGSLPAGITLNVVGTFAGTATSAGSTIATIEAADTHGGKATTTLAVSVQADPAFTAASTNTSQLVSIGSSLAALQATMAAGETLTFTVAGGSLPAGISLNANGTFTGIVTTVGSTTVTIRAVDTLGAIATTTLNVTVQETPAFTGAGANASQLVSAGSGLAALQATAAAGETLIYTVAGGSLPAGISLNADGTFTGSTSTVGNTSATILASDTHGGTASTTLNVTVQAGVAYTGAPTNTNQLISKGSGLAALQAIKAAGEALSFTLRSGALPAGITLYADGTFAGTVTTTGTTTALIEAADTHGGKAMTTLNVTVQVGPSFATAASNTNQLVSVTSSLAALQTTMAVGETLTFSVSSGSLPAGITLNADGTFSGTATTVGSTSAVIQAADMHGGIATTTLVVTVQPGPAYTVAGTNAGQTVRIGASLAALQATAAAGETLTFSIASGTLPAGIMLNADGAFTGTTTAASDTTATIRVSDTHGGSAMTTLAVTVQPDPAFTLAAANTSQFVSAGSGLSSLQATAAAGETLTFTLLTGTQLPAGISLNADGTFAGTATTAGATSATIQATDTHGASATTTLNVTVQEQPAFSGDEANTEQVIRTGDGLTALTATMAAGETLTFTLTGGTLPAGITLNADGTFAGTAASAGNTSATIQAADTHGGIASTTLHVRVTSPISPGSGAGSGSGSSDPTPTQATRQAVVQVGDGALSVKVDIVRVESPDGMKIDKVSLDPNALKEAAGQTGQNDDTIRIIIDDLASDPAQEIEVGISQSALQALIAGRRNLEIQTDHATLTLPKQSMLEAAAQTGDPYFRIVPIQSAADQKETAERVANAAEVRVISGLNKAVVVGTPMTIETNFQNHVVQVLFPLDPNSMPADPAERRDFLKSLSVYIEHSDGENIVQQGTIRNDADGMPIGIEIEVNKFSTFTVFAVQDNKHSPYLSGYPSGEFQPERPITRAEMAAILARLISGNSEAGRENVQPFADVPMDYWAIASIQKVKAAHLMEGDENGLFRPEDGISRAEMAVILGKWAELSQNAQSSGMADVESHWAQPFIDAAIAGGLMTGYPDGTFQPDQPLTRAEAVVVLNHLLKRGPLKGVADPTWSDVPADYWAFPMIEEASRAHSYQIGQDGSETLK